MRISVSLHVKELLVELSDFVEIHVKILNVELVPVLRKPTSADMHLCTKFEHDFLSLISMLDSKRVDYTMNTNDEEE